MSKSKILFGLSGSIAAYKACFVISRLVQEGHEVQTVVTENALKFIGPATLEGLTGRPPLKDAFEEGRMMDHIHLTKWADLFIVAPATANTINSLASGAGGGVLGALFLAYNLKEKPFLVAPAMNKQMWDHPLTQKKMDLLREIGVKILAVDSGRQACGDVGFGRLLNHDALFDEIIGFLNLEKR